MKDRLSLFVSNMNSLVCTIHLQCMCFFAVGGLHTNLQKVFFSNNWEFNRFAY